MLHVVGRGSSGIWKYHFLQQRRFNISWGRWPLAKYLTCLPALKCITLHIYRQTRIYGHSRVITSIWWPINVARVLELQEGYGKVLLLETNQYLCSGLYPRWESLPCSVLLAKSVRLLRDAPSGFAQLSSHCPRQRNRTSLWHGPTSFLFRLLRQPPSPIDPNLSSSDAPFPLDFLPISIQSIVSSPTV